MAPTPCICWRRIHGGTAFTAAASARRGVTTGKYYSYQPGLIARSLRSCVRLVLPPSVRRRVARRLQRGMEKVKSLEQEQLWLRRHGSPLLVMGLPDHAELAEVRARYRSLILETHPDTTTAVTTTGESDYELLQTAYEMATNPDSLWHRNGSSMQLYQQLMVGRAASLPRISRVRLFVLTTVTLTLLAILAISVLLVPRLLEATLRFFDPEFYDFMLAQEREEARRAAMGEIVDTDPKRLAPSVLKRLLYPGRYLRADDDAADGLGVQCGDESA